jgi:hypothetical protein
MPQVFDLPDAAMRGAARAPVFSDSAGLSTWGHALPSCSSILRLGRQLKLHKRAVRP